MGRDQATVLSPFLPTLCLSGKMLEHQTEMPSVEEVAMEADDVPPSQLLHACRR